MVTKIISGAIHGIDGYRVDVEVDISPGLPSFEIVGLPDSSIKESKERVRSAIKNSNLEFPIKKITINLAPANTKKEGPYFDLPIAIGILNSINKDIVSDQNIKNTFFCGELSLDGSIKPINGILPMVHNASKNNIKKFIVPLENANEASLISEIEVIGVSNLNQLLDHFKKNTLRITVPNKNNLLDYSNILDFSDVKGQDNVKRALEISAAGFHNIIIIGPPGSGKTMMARRLPSILPPLTFEESIDVTKIYSVAGLIKNKNFLIKERPFRAPHHTISYSALTGGGKIPKPGEISLAHNGVLFLDELPEFNRNALEIMRQPLEDKYITISRVNKTITYPSNFILICSMNPCKCGFYGYDDKCTCSTNEINKYLGKISGPLLDRIDIHIEATKLDYSSFETKKISESSESIRKRVLKAHEIQKNRYKNENINFNSNISSSHIEKYCDISKEGHAILKQAFNSMNLSARAYHKIIKVARTIADLENSLNIDIMHISEAIQYRNLDRKFF